MWDSWSAGALRADAASGEFIAADAGRFAHRGRHFDISGRFTTPPGPQGHPVIIQSGESDAGREFAASDAEVVFSKHNRIDVAREFYRDVKRRLATYGRSPDDLLILPTANAVVADTDEEAAAYAEEISRELVSPQTAIAHLEAVWGRDLSAYDPDGPLPGIEPEGDAHLLKGHSVFRKDRAETARQWRELAEERNLSIRELVIEVGGRQTFVGSPQTVADAIDGYVQSDGADGFVLVPTSRRAAWTTSWTGWCRSSRRGASTATTTPAPRSATTWAWPPHPARPPGAAPAGPCAPGTTRRRTPYDRHDG